MWSHVVRSCLRFVKASSPGWVVWPGRSRKTNTERNCGTRDSSRSRSSPRGFTPRKMRVNFCQGKSCRSRWTPPRLMGSSSADSFVRSSRRLLDSENSYEQEAVWILCTGTLPVARWPEGLLRDQAGDHFEVFSAGVEPSRVRREAIAFMKEIGIDLTGHRSKHVNEFAGQSFDY